jgi:transcriptional regulator with XRE-family HTH domain
MITADQIRAARALLRLEQTDLARRSGVSASTIRRVERPDGIDDVAPETVGQVQQALEEAGVEFIQDGVRRVHRRSPEEREAVFQAIMKIARESAAELAGETLFTDDDLYDENGLPK